MRLRRQHECRTWCQGRLEGVVTNQKLLGHIPESWQFDILSVTTAPHNPDLRGFTVECQHHRLYYLRRVDVLYGQKTRTRRGRFWQRLRRREVSNR